MPRPGVPGGPPCPGARLCTAGLDGQHRVGRRSAQRQAEVAVDGLNGPDRIGDEVVVPHIAELRLVVPRPHRHEVLQAAGPQLKLVPADHLAGEPARPALGRMRGQAACRRDRHSRRPVCLDHQRVRVHGQ